MGWLSYSDDEVASYHPAFKSAADEALQLDGLDGTYEWIQHKRTPGNPIVPDFVLIRKVDKRWLLALEIKRTREAVYSTRNQLQAKSYAELNQNLYRAGAPRYFVISNLEVILLFALNGGRPPLECLLAGGVFHSGNFIKDLPANHRDRFVADLRRLVSLAIAGNVPVFDTVWPAILTDLLSHAGQLPPVAGIELAQPTSPKWPVVRDYFASSNEIEAARMFFLRCLLTEYLRGALIQNGHPRASTVPPLFANAVPESVANSIDSLRGIDFHTVFDAAAASIYRSLAATVVTNYLRPYVTTITTPPRRVVELATSRVDAPELLDSLMDAIYPVETQDELGKVQTDPDLAGLLAALTIREPRRLVVDPCCGDGILLSAAYDRLLALGTDHGQALAGLAGVEADAVAIRLACVRLALKEGAALSPTPPIGMVHGDMFASPHLVSSAHAVVMNPPFKRYEAQDGHPVPQALRAHYAEEIAAIDGVPAATTGGQANLFNFYVEFVGKAMAAGARAGIILDNKWYHNTYGRPLKRFLLEHFEIEAIVEYPYSAFFASWTIATSIVIVQKVENIDVGHPVRFIRCTVDPRGVDPDALARAAFADGPWPVDWTCRTIPQGSLDAGVGWKKYFATQLAQDFRRPDWPTLDALFAHSRRGSLQKEEGGIKPFEFPFGLSNYGPRRVSAGPSARRYQTRRDRDLTKAENAKLAKLAEKIPSSYRGYALKNSDDAQHFQLADQDVTRQETIEPPRLRASPSLFRSPRRSSWTSQHDSALVDMRSEPGLGTFIAEVEHVVNLTEKVLPREELWTALREPYAGELVIPRKMREGHRVHINPFAFDEDRQVRLSSNFISYSDCQAVEPETGLDKATAARLIAAYLISSFGQLQFEIEGYNREGLLAIEKEHLTRVRVFDPRWIRPERRQSILAAFGNLPYPVRTDRLSPAQPERNALDELFAEEIANRFHEFNPMLLLAEVHTALDDWLLARQP